MKKILGLLMAILLLNGCTQKEEVPFTQNLTYSNLADEASQSEVRSALEYAGIAPERIDYFFENVDRFNQTVGKELLVDGFVTIDGLLPEYDEFEMQDRWEKKYPTEVGFNCRLTTYGLLQDIVSFHDMRALSTDEYFLDSEVLGENRERFTDNSQMKFRTLFSGVVKEGSQSRYPNYVKKWMDDRGFYLQNTDKLSIISVYFEVDKEYSSVGSSYVFVGHTGILIRMPDEKLLFIEKLAFQEPYQAVRFDNRTQLNDYLMNRYDIEWGQKTVRPFIMENGKLMEGYRTNPANPDGGKTVKK